MGDTLIKASDFTLYLKILMVTRCKRCNHSETSPFRTFLTQGGTEFWSQLAEILIACRNARKADQGVGYRDPVIIIVKVP
jgi:hypothetical protein